LPHDEAVDAFNSYPGNLPRELDAEKARRLSERIELSFGSPPGTCLAGRCGFGPNTAEIREDLGFVVEIIPAVPIDFSADGGPDYAGFTSHRFWFGRRRRLLCLPGTGGCVGELRPDGTPLYGRVTSALTNWSRRAGVIARLRLLECIRLSPEEYDKVVEMQRPTTALPEDGVRVFVFSFHPPSVMPSGTPCVRRAAELERFLAKCRRCSEHFFGRLNGLTTTPLQIKSLLQAQVLGAAHG